jgi:regulator of sigma E protease
VGLHVIASDIILADITLGGVLGTLIVILEVLVGLGMVIFVHELGHFAVAKWCGVKCEKFYIGFDVGGKNLGKFQWGETEYGIGIIPLGGYVKMLGQEDNPSRVQEEIERAKLSGESGESSPDQPLYDPRSYLAQPVWKRMAIISAGVIMNVIFAFVVASIAFGMGVKYTPAVLMTVFPGDPAWQVGLRPGDQVLEVGSVTKPQFEDIMQAVTFGSDEDGVPMKIKRPGVDEPISMRVFPTRIHPDALAPMMGVSPAPDRVLDDPPAYEFLPAGKTTPPFQAGDQIVAVEAAGERTTIENYNDLHRVFATHPGDTLTFTVRREADGAEAAISVQPQRQKELGLVMEMGKITAVQEGSPAAQAGIKPNDQLVKIDGQLIDDPMHLPEELRQRGGETVKLTLQRGRDVFETDATLREVTWFEFPAIDRKPMSAPALGIAYTVLNRVHDVLPGSPAAAADIKPGDVIVKAEIVPADPQGDKVKERGELTIEFGDNQPNWPYFMARRLQFLLPDSKVRLTVQGREGAVELTPAVSEEWFVTDYDHRGLALKSMREVRRASSLGEAATLGARETLDKLSMVFRVIQKIGSGRVSPKALGGPGTIAAVAGSAASQGMPELLLFLTMLSANLAVVNFLPIPLLDGGHMMFLGYEAIFRRPANERVALVLHYAGFAFIISLMAFVLFLDAERGFHWVVN